jgi:hypothetical protein
VASITLHARDPRSLNSRPSRACGLPLCCSFLSHPVPFGYRVILEQMFYTGNPTGGKLQNGKRRCRGIA